MPLSSAFCLSLQLCLILWSKGLGASEQWGNLFSKWIKAMRRMSLHMLF